jgi:putative acetyltransferase
LINIIAITQEGLLLEEVKKLFIAYQKELDENLCFQSFEEELENPLKKYGLPNGLLFIATYNNEIAGCIALQPLLIKGEGEMKRMYVKPIYRKHQMGKALIEKLLVEAKNIGMVKIKLDTLQRLIPAINLYEKYGFTHTTPYYTNPLSNVVYMEKLL